MSDNVIKLIKEQDVKFIDMRFCDTTGKEKHLTIPANTVDVEFFKEGKIFDSSSIDGWKEINESDIVLMPECDTAVIDPFFDDVTLIVRCDVLEPATMRGYERDPRSLAKRAESYLESSGIADAVYFLPEPEFFIFDEVRWKNEIHSAFYEIDSEEGCWNSGRLGEDNNIGHRPSVKRGNFSAPPVDSGQNIRSAICTVLEEMDVGVGAHHHEVATAGQAVISTIFNTLTRKADEILIFKYVVQNIAHSYGKTATFMPKPLVGETGSGMHIHQFLVKAGENLFVGEKYGGLSDLALHYIGGIIKHARALNAFTNASTNSYKRLMSGFEVPTKLGYSINNRSVSCRIPSVSSPEARHIEICFPDSCGNPYFTFASIMMAGLDGIQNKTDPGEACEKNLYVLGVEENKNISTICFSLDQALKALDEDREFLTAGGVFTDDMIDGYIALKRKDVTRLQTVTHPIEFDMYYSL